MMIYIYDILVNFSDSLLYEFYEWNHSDHIENMKKIKLLKVSKQDFDCFCNHKIQVESDFLMKIFKTCEVYLSKGTNILDYACLISDGMRVLAVEFNAKGIIECRSKLLLDEEEEIAVLASNLEFMAIPYKILKEDNKNRFLTRKEIKVRRYLMNEIKESYRLKNYNKLRFLYIEYFEEREDEPKKMFEALLDSMKESLDIKHMELYQYLRLSHQKKQV
ncbi:MAG: DUF3603 family protein [bacterium]|nr:DUF3603 family protein [bacterium]